MSEINKKNKRYFGFTLVEVLVVMSITILISTSLVVNFSRSRSDLTQVTLFMAAQVRNIQERANSGVQYSGATKCGYGIVASTPTSFDIVVGPNSNSVDCTNISWPYTVIETISLQDPNLEFKTADAPKYFSDIFFEPPNSRTYINGSSTLGIPPATILIGYKRRRCLDDPSKCRAVCVYSSGKIETPLSITCPAT
jgi:prepilin-type N-terminal cleavage/methylation domain-containing protein